MVIRMGLAATEQEIEQRAVRLIKSERKRAEVTYALLAERLNDHRRNLAPVKAN